MEDKALRRAGLDYHEWARVRVHDSYDEFLTRQVPASLWALTTKGQRSFYEVPFAGEAYFLFGPETRGLPESVRDAVGTEQCLRLPMQPDSRSMNLSNSVAVVAFEAWRQSDFIGAHWPSGQPADA